MIATCPSCKSRYKIADDKIQGRGARITCPSCKHKFEVYRQDDKPPMSTEPPRASATLGGSAGVSVPVTIARKGELYRAPGLEEEEEQPTTLMPHGSSLPEIRRALEMSGHKTPMRLPREEDEDADLPVVVESPPPATRRPAEIPIGPPPAAPNANAAAQQQLVVFAVAAVIAIVIALAFFA